MFNDPVQVFSNALRNDLITSEVTIKSTEFSRLGYPTIVRTRYTRRKCACYIKSTRSLSRAIDKKIKKKIKFATI